MSKSIWITEDGKKVVVSGTFSDAPGLSQAQYKLKNPGDIHSAYQVDYAFESPFDPMAGEDDWMKFDDYLNENVTSKPKMEADQNEAE